MNKNNEVLVRKFQVTELEQRLEMAKWTAKVSSTQTFNSNGTSSISNTQELSVSWGK